MEITSQELGMLKTPSKFLKECPSMTKPHNSSEICGKNNTPSTGRSFRNHENNLWETDIGIESVDRYSRQIVVPGVGVSGQLAISAAKVLVVGVGGLGSPVITYLVMAGVGTMGIADFDTVELHNLQRQSIHTEDRIGEYKTKSASEFVGRLNSTVKVIEHRVSVNRGNVKEIIEKYDIVVDCSDQAKLRYLLNDACRIMNKDLICASVLRWEGQVFILSKTGNCFRCVFPEPKTSAPNCDQSGVVGPMCGVIGCIQATEVLKLICARDSGTRVESKMILYNGYSNEQRTFSRRYGKCKVCEGKELGDEEYNGVVCSNGEIKTDSKENNMKDCCAAERVALGNSKKSDENQVSELFWRDVIENRDSYVIVDIRKRVHYEMFRMKGSINIPVIEESLEEIRGFEKPVVVLCYRGNTSRSAVKFLNENGIKALSLRGGIEEFKTSIGYTDNDG